MSCRWKRRPAKIEDVKKKINARARKMLCLGQWQWPRRGWRQPQEIQRERKESKQTNGTPQDSTWLGGAQRGSLWLCYAGPLAEKRKSEISGKRHRPKPIPWETHQCRSALLVVGLSVSNLYS